MHYSSPSHERVLFSWFFLEDFLKSWDIIYHTLQLSSVPCRVHWLTKTLFRENILNILSCMCLSGSLSLLHDLLPTSTACTCRLPHSTKNFCVVPETVTERNPVKRRGGLYFPQLLLNLFRFRVADLRSWTHILIYNNHYHLIPGPVLSSLCGFNPHNLSR